MSVIINYYNRDYDFNIALSIMNNVVNEDMLDYKSSSRYEIVSFLKNIVNGYCIETMSRQFAEDQLSKTSAILQYAYFNFNIDISRNFNFLKDIGELCKKSYESAIYKDNYHAQYILNSYNTLNSNTLLQVLESESIPYIASVAASANSQSVINLYNKLVQDNISPRATEIILSYLNYAYTYRVICDAQYSIFRYIMLIKAINSTPLDYKGNLNKYISNTPSNVIYQNSGNYNNYRPRDQRIQNLNLNTSIVKHEFYYNSLYLIDNKYLNTFLNVYISSDDKFYELYNIFYNDNRVTIPPDQGYNLIDGLIEKIIEPSTQLYFIVACLLAVKRHDILNIISRYYNIIPSNLINHETSTYNGCYDINYVYIVNIYNQSREFFNYILQQAHKLSMNIYSSTLNNYTVRDIDTILNSYISRYNLTKEQYDLLSNSIRSAVTSRFSGDSNYEIAEYIRTFLKDYRDDIVNNIELLTTNQNILIDNISNLKKEYDNIIIAYSDRVNDEKNKALTLLNKVSDNTISTITKYNENVVKSKNDKTSPTKDTSSISGQDGKSASGQPAKPGDKNTTTTAPSNTDKGDKSKIEKSKTDQASTGKTSTSSTDKSTEDKTKTDQSSTDKSKNVQDKSKTDSSKVDSKDKTTPSKVPTFKNFEGVENFKQLDKNISKEIIELAKGTKHTNNDIKNILNKNSKKDIVNDAMVKSIQAAIRKLKE